MSNPSPQTGTAPCPCGSGDSYTSCCEQVHVGGAGLGTTAEMLVRARYCAYIRRDLGFLTSTWHPDTVPANFDLEPNTEWLRLEIHRTDRGGMLDNDGVVDFTAHFTLRGETYEHRELSEFVRVDGAWVYTDALPNR